jgi:hypothetical protein
MAAVPHTAASVGNLMLGNPGRFPTPSVHRSPPRGLQHPEATPCQPPGLRSAREALAHDHPLAPRRRGDREALRVLLATRHSACAAKVSAINPAQGADRGRTRGATGRAAQPGHQTTSWRPGCATTQPPAPTPPGARARARAPAISAGAESGPSPGSCSSCWSATIAGLWRSSRWRDRPSAHKPDAKGEEPPTETIRTGCSGGQVEPGEGRAVELSHPHRPLADGQGGGRDAR